MKNLFIILPLVMLVGCKEVAIDLPGKKPDPVTNTAHGYINHSITKGSHHSDKNILKSFSGSGVSFNIKFDNTAIYTTLDPGNQNDINKVFGFSEGADNHENSARIGWNWNHNALRLYAYVYAAGVLHSQEIISVGIGVPIRAEINVVGSQYVFSVEGKKVSLPRAMNSPSATGYIQYPYFGGNEVAPHTINIAIQPL